MKTEKKCILNIFNTFPGIANFYKNFSNADVLLSTTSLSSPRSDVLRGRRNRDNVETDFTANEVANGTLLTDVVPANIQALYNNVMWFDGEEDATRQYIDLTTTIQLSTSTGFRFDFNFFSPDVEGGTAAGFGVGGQFSTNGIFFSGVGAIAFYGGGNAKFVSFTPIVKNHTLYRFSLRCDGTNFYIYDITDGTETLLGSDAVGTVSDIDVDFLGEARGREAYGSLWDVRINDSANNDTWTATYAGTGNTPSDWVDGVGSNDGVPISDPALFTGQDFNGFTSKWYDQRVSTATDTLYFNGVDSSVDAGTALIADVHNFDVTINFVAESTGGASKTLYAQSNLSDNNPVVGIYYDSGSLGNGKIYLFVRPDGSSSPLFNTVADTAITDGRPHKIQIINDNGTVAYFLDGVADGGGSYTPSGTYTFNAYTFGLTKRIVDGSPYAGAMFDMDIDGTLVSGRGTTSADWNGYTLNNFTQRISRNDGTISMDFVQETAADQPKAVNNGQLVKINDVPAIMLDGAASYVEISATDFVTATTYAQGSIVYNGVNATLAAIETLFGQWDTGSNERAFLFYLDTSERLALLTSSDGTSATNATSTAITLNEPQVLWFVKDGTTVTLGKNTTTLTTSGSAVATLHDSSANAAIGASLSVGTPANFLEANVGSFYFSTSDEDNIEDVVRAQMRQFRITA